MSASTRTPRGAVIFPIIRPGRNAIRSAFHPSWMIRDAPRNAIRAERIHEFLTRRQPIRHVALLADGFLQARSIGSCPASTVGVKIQRPPFELAVEVRYGRSCGASVRRMPSIDVLGMRAVAGLTALRRFRRTFCASRNIGLVICGWPACCVGGHFRKRAAIDSGGMAAPAHGIGVFLAGERLGYGADSMFRLAGVRTGADVTRLTIMRSGWSLIGWALGLGVCPAAGFAAIRGLVTVAGVLYGRAARTHGVGVFLAGQCLCAPLTASVLTTRLRRGGLLGGSFAVAAAGVRVVRSLNSIGTGSAVDAHRHVPVAAGRR